jgi:triosephosphate isomerase
VGENSRDDNHEYFNVVKNQILECLQGVKKNQISKIIFAYEPVWAISSTPGRRDATPEDAREMAVFIRKTISDIAGPQVVNQMGVIYGGSVTEKDIGDFLQSGGVDGVLVGKASLNVEKFVKIISIAESVS